MLQQTGGREADRQVTSIFLIQNAVKYWERLMDRVFNNYEVDGWKVDESDYYLRGFSTIKTADRDKTPEAIFRLNIIVKCIIIYISTKGKSRNDNGTALL